MGIWSGVKKMENVENDTQVEVDEKSGVDSDSDLGGVVQGRGNRLSKQQMANINRRAARQQSGLHCPNALWPLLGTALASRYCLCYLTFLMLRVSDFGILDHSYSWGRFQDEYYIFN